MAVINPNALSDAEYWARANALANAAPSPEETLWRQVGNFETPAQAAAPQGWIPQLAANTAQGGVPIQQNGYVMTAAAPVAAGPAVAGPSPLPAYPRSGPNVSMPGSREAWEQWGVSPVIMQSSPYATAVARISTDPYGQIGVQPLIGFPSAYPHVLSGVPNNPFRVQGFVNALLPAMPSNLIPTQTSTPTPTPTRAAAKPPAGVVTTKKKTVQRAAPNKSSFLYGDTDTMPLPASYQRLTPQVASMPQVNRALDGAYLPPVVAQPERQFDGAYLPPVVAQPERQFDGAYMPLYDPTATLAAPYQIPQIQAKPSFTPDLLTAEEAQETADGMYIDPNKTLMQNLLEGLGAASVPLSLGAGPLLYSAPRIVGAEVAPEVAGVLPAAARASSPGAVPLSNVARAPLPTGAAPLPTGAAPLPTGAAPLPTGAAPLPTGAAPLPPGTNWFYLPW